MPASLRHRKWFGADQPQTLQIAVALLYWNALLSLVFGLIAGGFGRIALLLVVADAASGFGVANERKWGYYVALGAAFLPLVLVLAGVFAFGGVLNLLFQVALIVLLLHPMSRDYFKIWFR